MKVDNYTMQLREPKEGEKEGEIDAVILTLKPGQEGEGTMIMPEEHPDPGLRGKEARFKVKLHSISKENLPTMDDELAKRVGFQDEAQMRKIILDQAMNSKLRDVKSKGQNKLLESVIDSLDYPLPESLVSLHLNEYLAEARNQMMRQGADGNAMNESLERMREEGLVQARVQAKSQAFLMALAFREGIEVSENDVNRQIYQMAQESGQDFQKLAEAFYQSGRMDDLQERILASKALDFMYAKAKKIVVDKDGKPVAPPKTGDNETESSPAPSESAE